MTKTPVDDESIRAGFDEVLRTNLRTLRPDDQFGPELRLQEDLGLNSVDLIEIILDLEERFGIHIDDQDLGAYFTVGDLWTVITSQLRPDTADTI